MTNVRKRASTNYPVCFLMIDSANRPQGLAALSPTVTISKNGGSFAAALGVVTEIGSGWYALAGHADDRDTLGELIVQAEAVGADPASEKLFITAVDPGQALLVAQASVLHKRIIDQAIGRVQLFDEAGLGEIGRTEEVSSSDGVTITRNPAVIPT